jgi:hypothetical protein
MWKCVRESWNWSLCSAVCLHTWSGHRPRNTHLHGKQEGHNTSATAHIRAYFKNFLKTFYILNLPDRKILTCKLGHSLFKLYRAHLHLWSSDQSSWLQIQRSRVWLWVVVGLEWGPLSLVWITEELLEWKSNGSVSRNPRLTAIGIRCADHATPFIRKSWH